jgi:hypothetical protein
MIAQPNSGDSRNDPGNPRLLGYRQDPKDDHGFRNEVDFLLKRAKRRKKV